MAVFGCLINEINKCSASITDASISSCANMINVCTTYAKKKDDFVASPTLSQPKQSPTRHPSFQKIKKKKHQLRLQAPLVKRTWIK